VLEIADNGGTPGTVANKSGSFNLQIASGATLYWNSSASQTMGTLISMGGGVTVNKGTLTLTAANTYTGNTTLTGGTLNLGGDSSTGSISSSSALVCGGGTLSFTRTGTNTQTFASTAVKVGASVVNTTVSTDTIALNAITRSVGGTVDFGATGTITTTTANTQTGILGPWATVGGSNWANSAGTGTVAGNITALSSYTD